MADLRPSLEGLYRKLNLRRFVHPDPLETLYPFPDPPDQEIVGLVAAGLAYGRVSQILASIGRITDVLGPRPRAFLEQHGSRSLAARLAGFKHRFTTGAEVASLLVAVSRAIASHGSLERLFTLGLARSDETVLPALARFVGELRRLAPCPCPSLLASPEDGSACKRMNLYLRWMARRDAVDPGPWRSVSPRLLVVPLDTHMFRIGKALGLTARGQPTLPAALEITRGFARVAPRDPVRYDFALTRLAIHPDCRGIGMAGLLEAPAAHRQGPLAFVPLSP